MTINIQRLTIREYIALSKRMLKDPAARDMHNQIIKRIKELEKQNPNTLVLDYIKEMFSKVGITDET